MSTKAMMFVRHKVADYAAWKQIYDEAEPIRQQGGVIAHSVYHDSEDANVVIVTHEFPDLAAASAYAGAPGLREAMMRAGVVEAPTFWFGVSAL